MKGKRIKEDKREKERWIFYLRSGNPPISSLNHCPKSLSNVKSLSDLNMFASKSSKLKSVGNKSAAEPAPAPVPPTPPAPPFPPAPEPPTPPTPVVPPVPAEAENMFMEFIDPLGEGAVNELVG
jgi:hypothetical protein